jgi:NodT family efflux transporter outer membrane factor (OMF) lipoprotein
MRVVKHLPALAVAALAAACAAPGASTTGKTLDPATLQAEDSLRAAPVAREPLAPGWWKRYGDPQLDGLVDEAIAGNPSIGLVRARVEQAQAAAATVRLGLTPSIAGSVESSRQRLSENGLVPPPFGGMWIWQNQATVGFRYQLDLWGKNRKAYEAALGTLAAAEMDAQAARLLLETAIVRTYLQLQAAFEQEDIAHATLGQREGILSITRGRYDAGLDSELEVRQAEGAVPAARGEVLAAEQATVLARDQLGALVGAGPDRGLALRRPALGAIDVAIPSTLPADLVGRRPDVIAQRLRIEAAGRGIESARAAFYPNIDLTAFVGLQALDFAKFLRPGSLTVGAGPALSLPLFEQGSLRASLAVRSAEWDLAVAQYNQTVVDALREVVDQVTALRTLEGRETEVASALASAERAHAISLARYRGGLGNYLQVLSTEGQVLAQRALQADLRARHRDAAVALIQALGGGYEAHRPGGGAAR